MTGEIVEMEENIQCAGDPFKWKNSNMCFSWLCEEEDCLYVNHLDYTHWKVYGALDTCVKCERAFKIRAPWENVGG